MEQEQVRLSDLYERFAEQYQFTSRSQLSELVHDSLAIEHYPHFTEWMREYGEGRDVHTCEQIFLRMRRHRKEFKALVGDNYELFLDANLDL